MRRWLFIVLTFLLAACGASTAEPTASVEQALTLIPLEGGSFNGATSGASSYSGTCEGSLAPEQVFQWKAPRSGTATFSTCGGQTNFDTALYVRKDTITGTQAFCNDDAVPACANDASKGSTSVTACKTYFIFVDGWSTSHGNFTLTVTPPSGTGTTCATDAGQDGAVDATADSSDSSDSRESSAEAALEAEAAASESGSDVNAQETGTEASDAVGDPSNFADGDASAGSDGGNESAGGDGGNDESVGNDASGTGGDVDASVDAVGDGGVGADASDGGEAGTGGTYPLKLQSGARYLVDQQGNPFLIHGEAAWSLIAQLTDADVETYLADRQSRGVNSIIVNLVEHMFSDNAPADIYGHQPFLTPGDFTTPNEAYFARVDSVLRTMASHGIQALLFPDYLGNNGDAEGWYTEMIANGPTKMGVYGQYVGTRYAGFDNILWVLGGDFSPPPEGHAVVNAVATGILSRDSRHLMSAHGSSWTGSALDAFPGTAWLNVNSTYTGDVAGEMLSQYQRSDWLPVFHLESGYELEGPTRQELRQNAFAAILNGGFGQVFGNGAIWCFSSHCFAGGDWHQQLSSPGSQDQQRLRGFFAARSWWKLAPDTSHAFLTAGYAGASPERAADGSWAAAYLPGPQSVTVGLSSFAAPVTAKWFDPTSGAYTTIGTFPNAGTHVFSTPGNNSAGQTDWALVLE